MNRIKEKRLEYGFSQKELAAMCNVHQSAVSQWENEKTWPDKNTLSQLADIFETSTDFLLGRTDYINDDAKADAEADAYSPQFTEFGGNLKDYMEFKKAEQDDALKLYAEMDKTHPMPPIMPLRTLYASDNGELENMTDEQLYELQLRIIEIMKNRK